MARAHLRYRRQGVLEVLLGHRDLAAERMVHLQQQEDHQAHHGGHQADRQRVLSGILRSERFPNDIYPRLQLMIKDVNSLINHADFSFQRLDYIQDAALGLINIEQNEIVKIFSVAAVVFMPATLIASIYGMNFSIMPELHWKYGYLFAIGLMLLCSGLTIWFFRFKKWL